MRKEKIAPRRHNITIPYQDELPLDIKEEILKNYKEYTIDRAKIFEENGSIFYDVVLVNGKKRNYLRINDKGKILKKG